MKLPVNASVLLLLLISSHAYAYVPNMGGSGGGSACAKPKFTHFIPEANAEVKANSEFSFVASANTHPNSIKVTVKGEEVELTMSPKSENAFKVSGRIPKTFKNTFVRVSIEGKASSECKGTDGWLLKVGE